MIVTVRAPSRLHFGLMAVGPEHSRVYGGIGLALAEPGIVLSARPTSATSITAGSPTAADARAVPQGILVRAEALVSRILRPRPIAIKIASAPPEHVGLGTGTQLSLALAAAADRLEGGTANAVELARRTGRGARSAIGIHAFARGGFLVDGGKSPDSSVAPLVAHAAFPAEWPIVLLRAPGPTGLAGELERTAFESRIAISPFVTERLARLVLLEILPALVEGNYPGFAEALGLYNRLVGQSFASVQGGQFGSPRMREIVDRLREWGLPASGQSSWGPTLFAIAPDSDRAHWLIDRAGAEFSLPEGAISLTRANNVGACVEVSNSDD